MFDVIFVQIDLTGVELLFHTFPGQSSKEEVQKQRRERRHQESEHRGNAGL